MKQAEKAVGLSNAISKDWSREMELIKKAVSHQNHVKKNGVNGDYTESELQTLYKGLDSASVAVTKWVNTRGRKPADSLARETASTKQNETANEIDRFKNNFKGQTRLFVVVSQDNGGFASSHDLVLQDEKTKKKFMVAYTFGLGKSLGVKNGETVSVRFSSSGEPQSVKNESSGVSYSLDNWKASGYGW